MGNLFNLMLLLQLLLINKNNVVFSEYIDFNIENNKVLITFDDKIQRIDVPVSKNPISSSIHIVKGNYPNMQIIDKDVTIKIGDELSILVSIEDKSNLYDAKVNDCFASTIRNNADYIAFGNENQTSASKIPKLSEWKKITNPRYSTVVLISHFTAFKFPDAENIFITCDIQLCYKLCKD